MLKFAHSEECPVEDRIKVIEGANEILNAHYKEWADTIPDRFSYNVVKKEAVGYNSFGKAEVLVKPKRSPSRDIRTIVWFYQINPDTNKTEAKYRTLEEAATKIGGQPNGISHAINKRNKKAYGYRWKKRVFHVNSHSMVR
jgi:hypothetical protein